METYDDYNYESDYGVEVDDGFSELYDDVFLDAPGEKTETYTLYTPPSTLPYTTGLDTTTFSLEALFAFLGAFLGIIIAAVATFSLIMLIANWKILTKAGEKGWKVLIPFYNYWTFFKIAGLPPALSLLLLVPVVNFVVLIVFYVYLSRAFGKSGFYALGLVFLNFIFTLILAFDKSVYIGAQSAAPAPDPAPASVSELPVQEASVVETPTSVPEQPSTPVPEPPQPKTQSAEPISEKPVINIPVKDMSKSEETSESEPIPEEPKPESAVQEAPAPEITSDPSDSVPEEYTSSLEETPPAPEN